MSGDRQIRAFIDRVLRLKEEQDALAADIRDVYAEAKSMGFDKTAMGGVVAHLRRVEKKGTAEVEEAATIFDLYLSAYQRAAGAKVANAHTHEIPHSSAAALTPADEQAGAGSPPRAAPAANSIPQPNSSREADKAGDAPFLPASSANHIPDFVPAFLVGDARPKPKLRPFRPNCLNPEVCAGQGNRHCYTCEKAASAKDVAA